MQCLADSVFPKPCRRRHTCTLSNYSRSFFQVTLTDCRKLGLNKKQHPLKIFALCFGYFHNLPVDSFDQIRFPPSQNRSSCSNPKRLLFLSDMLRFHLVIFGSGIRIYSHFSPFFLMRNGNKCKSDYTHCINIFSLICVENRVEKVNNLTRKACFINISECGKLLFFFSGTIFCL